MFTTSSYLVPVIPHRERLSSLHKGLELEDPHRQVYISVATTRMPYSRRETYELHGIAYNVESLFEGSVNQYVAFAGYTKGFRKVPTPLSPEGSD